MIRLRPEPLVRPRPSASPTQSPCRIMLMCPESLGAKVSCVEDSLRTRGYSVQVEVGRRARKFVRTPPPGPPVVRILCVTKIDPALAEKLRRGVDPEGRGFFHVIAFSTPHQLVQAIERRLGRKKSRRVPRPSRMILAQPTLIEQQLVLDQRWGRWRFAAVAAAVFLIGGAGTLQVTSEVVARPVRPAVAQALAERPATPPRRRAAEPILAAVRRGR